MQEINTSSMEQLIRFLLNMPEEVHQNLVKPGSQIIHALFSSLREGQNQVQPGSDQGGDSSGGDSGAASEQEVGQERVELKIGDKRVAEIHANGGKFNNLSTKERQGISQILGWRDGQKVGADSGLPPVELKYYPASGGNPTTLFRAAAGEPVINRLGEYRVAPEVLRQGEMYQPLSDSDTFMKRLEEMTGSVYATPGEYGVGKFLSRLNPVNWLRAGASLAGAALSFTRKFAVDQIETLSGDKSRKISATCSNNLKLLFQTFQQTPTREANEIDSSGKGYVPAGNWKFESMKLSGGLRLTVFHSPEHPQLEYFSLRDENNNLLYCASCGSERQFEVLHRSAMLRPEHKAVIDSLIDPELGVIISRHGLHDSKGYREWVKDGNVCGQSLTSLFSALNKYPNLAYVIPPNESDALVNVYATYVGGMLNGLRSLAPPDAVGRKPVTLTLQNDNRVDLKPSADGTGYNLLYRNQQSFLGALSSSNHPCLLVPPASERGGVPTIGLSVMREIALNLFNLASETVKQTLAYSPKQVEQNQSAISPILEFGDLLKKGTGTLQSLSASQLPRQPFDFQSILSNLQYTDIPQQQPQAVPEAPVTPVKPYKDISQQQPQAVPEAPVAPLKPLKPRRRRSSEVQL